MARLVPIHPGEILLEELKVRNISQVFLAKHIRVSPAYLNDIIRGRRGLSVEMAIKIARALGSNPEVWYNLQKQFDLNSADFSKFDDIKELAA